MSFDFGLRELKTHLMKMTSSRHSENTHSLKPAQASVIFILMLSILLTSKAAAARPCPFHHCETRSINNRR
jgi:hypothetical protein